MNLGATLFAYKGNVCVKRVVVVEEGQHVQISAADVRTFSWARGERDVAGQEAAVPCSA